MTRFYRNKYKNKPQIINGIRLDSTLEANVYCRLLLFQRSGLIRDLQVHRTFILQEAYKIGKRKVRAITYEADFTYTDRQEKEWIIDAKGVRTDVYKLKKKLFEYRYQKEITEITEYRQIDTCI